MLTDPECDDEGIVKPHDHEGILNEDSIIKRVSPTDIVKTEDGKTRISTALFSQSSDKYRGSSVNIEKVILQHAESCEVYCSQFEGVIGAISFEAKEVRSRGGKVGFEPLEDDQAHGEIWDLKSKGKIKQIMRKSELRFCGQQLDYIISPHKK